MKDLKTILTSVGIVIIGISIMLAMIAAVSIIVPAFIGLFLIAAVYVVLIEQKRSCKNDDRNCF